MAGLSCLKKSAIVISVFAAITLLIAVVLLSFIGAFNRLVDHMVHSSIVITPTSSVYSNWVEPGAPIHFSIYPFNITNPEDVLLGKKPHIQQIGPYVYREKRQKTNITWPKGDHSQVSFYQRITFFLDRNLSVGNPDTDIIIGISVPFVSLSANMEAGNGPTPDEYGIMTLFTDPQLFIKTTVTKFLWGYTDPIVEACNALDTKSCPSHKIGIMWGKNATDDGPFVIDTGVNDITQLGNIISYKGKSKLDVWSSESANQITGTDGSHFAPNLGLNSRRFVFASDLCRSFEMIASEWATLTNSEKLKVLSLSGTPETAEPASVNPDNQGFCPPKTPGLTCPPSGTFDLSSCRRQGTMRPPIYASQPYFFGADPALRNGVSGLPTPTVENASTKAFVEPKLGLVLEAYKRLQISVYVRPSKVLRYHFKGWVEPVFLPVVWFEERAIAGADELKMLHENAYVKPALGRLLLLIVFGVVLGLLLLLLIALLTVVIIIIRRNAHPSNDTKPVVYSQLVGEKSHQVPTSSGKDGNTRPHGIGTAAGTIV